MLFVSAALRMSRSLSRSRACRLHWFGPSSGRAFRPHSSGRERLRGARDRARRPIGFLALHGPEDRLDTIPVFPGNGRTVFSNLIHDGISANLHDDGSISSSGVQMIGGTSLARRHVSSILPRTAALARCRRFHVRRKSTPLRAAIATWAASTRAVVGNAPPRRRDRTSAPVPRPGDRMGMSRSSPSRRAAAIVSPLRASATTAAETYRSNRSRVAHQLRVACWCAA